MARRTMTLSIAKRTHMEWLVLVALTGPFFFFVLIDVMKFPSAIKYAIDLIWVFLLLTLFLQRKKLPNVQSKSIMLWYGLFFFSACFGVLLEYQNILYTLWGLRNYFRFFVIYFSMIVFLSSRSVLSFFRFMDKLFYVNFAVSLYQFFVMGYKQDYLGGIFGVEKGCNGYTNIFLLIVVMWHVLKYINGKETFKACSAKCIIALLIAALAELKVFFVEFALMVVLASLFTRFSARKMWIIVVGALGMLVALEIINQMFPVFANWFSAEGIVEIIASKKGYTQSNDMNRLTFFSIAMDRFLDTWPRKLLGLGLGNCDYASGIDFLTTPFYKLHHNLHYAWFSSAFLLLETGVVGLVLYVCVFVKVYFGARKRQKKGLADPTFCQMARIMAVMCPILVILNSSLRTEAGYMVYFVLALPFLKKEGREVVLKGPGNPECFGFEKA